MRGKTKRKVPRRGRRRPAPAGYLTIEEWGKQVGLGRTAAYAAARRGEVPTETIGQMLVREDWRDQKRRLAEDEAVERQRRHAEGLQKQRAREQETAT
jgi:hypothetical protein